MELLIISDGDVAKPDAGIGKYDAARVAVSIVHLLPACGFVVIPAPGDVVSISASFSIAIACAFL